ncbi:23S rRNA (adenine(2030)-N(6))-methyltransferase RlmJ, partial [Streptomyces scabiei]
LIASGVRNVQLFELATKADTDVHGMTASGMIVINPPWKLKQTMDAVLPELVGLLSDASGFYRSEQLVEE